MSAILNKLFYFLYIFFKCTYVKRTEAMQWRDEPTYKIQALDGIRCSKGSHDRRILIKCQTAFENSRINRLLRLIRRLGRNKR